MRYFISANFENLSMNLEKLDFEPIMNFVHMAERLVLVIFLNKNMDDLLYYPSRQHVK